MDGESTSAGAAGVLLESSPKSSGYSSSSADICLVDSVFVGDSLSLNKGARR
jgi:hypothetical protein